MYYSTLKTGKDMFARKSEDTGPLNFLRTGMSRDQVRLLMGSPVKITMYEEPGKIRELWQYHPAEPVYLFFQNDRLLSWQNEPPSPTPVSLTENPPWPPKKPSPASPQKSQEENRKQPIKTEKEIKKEPSTKDESPKASEEEKAVNFISQHIIPEEFLKEDQKY
jgi:hypothetical protein